MLSTSSADVVEAEVGDRCHDVQHELFRVGERLAAQEVKQRRDDGARGAADGPDRLRDGHVREQPYDLRNPGIVMVRCKAHATNFGRRVLGRSRILERT